MSYLLGSEGIPKIDLLYLRVTKTMEDPVFEFQFDTEALVLGHLLGHFMTIDLPSFLEYPGA